MSSIFTKIERTFTTNPENFRVRTEFKFYLGDYFTTRSYKLSVELVQDIYANVGTFKPEHLDFLFEEDKKVLYRELRLKKLLNK